LLPLRFYFFFFFPFLEPFEPLADFAIAAWGGLAPGTYSTLLP